MSTHQPVRRVAVIGGNGFVGSAVCREGLNRGLIMTSINRSGAPTNEPWTSKVTWVKGNVLDEQGESWKQALNGQDAVISCVGGFGSVEWMRTINGQATINAVRAAHQANIPRFGFVSAHHYSLPEFMKQGYFEGKMAAEREIKRLYGQPDNGTSASAGEHRSGVICNPGAIYGSRYVKSIGTSIPLQVVFAPIAFMTQFTKPLTSLPLVGPVLSVLLLPPVKVEQVAATMLDAICDDNANSVRSFSVSDIQQHYPKQ